MAINWNPFKSSKKADAQQSYSVPDKVYIEKENDYSEYSEWEPNNLKAKLDNLINGEYSTRNFIELFYTLPEVFAPVHEIAKRVSDANWHLKKEWNDEVDFKNEYFNKLFSQPNALTSFKDLIYQSVCYEILTGKQLWYFNKVSVFEENYKNIVAWFNLPAHKVLADLKKDINPYTITSISDLVNQWKTSINGKPRTFAVEDVLPVLHLSLKNHTDINNPCSYLLGASKAIKNLIPVYEARSVIYVKRGALGFLVSAKKDADGTKALTTQEKKDLRNEMNAEYGLRADKATVGITDQPVDFVKTAMSIAEMQPFDETLADAVAIYATLRVPRHLVPSKDHSTFNNAAADQKEFYESVIGPWGRRYAQIFTEYFKFERRYICADYSHLNILKENEKEKSVTDKTIGDIWQQRWLAGICTLNNWITAIEGDKGTGPLYEKKIFEMTPEEIVIVKEIMNLKSKVNDKGQQEADSATADTKTKA